MSSGGDVWSWRRHHSLWPALRRSGILLVCGYGILALLFLCNDREGRVVIVALAAALTGFVLAVALLLNVVPTRRLTRLDLLPAQRPDRIRVVCRYTSQEYPIGAVHAIWVQHGHHGIGGRLHLDLTVDGVRRHVPSWPGVVTPELTEDLTQRLAHTAVDVVAAPDEGEPAMNEDGLGWLVPFRGSGHEETDGDA